MSKTHRYPGVKPFTDKERHLFYGRTTDSQKLYKLISLEKLTLLYAKSGLGKSSLLNAGVMPLFVEDGEYTIVNIRLGAKTEGSFAPHATALAKLPKAEPNAILQKLEADEDLWMRTKALQSGGTGSGKTLILVFDQFEELFTYSAAEVEQFKRQLADVLYAKVPAYLRKSISNRLKADASFLTDEELAYLYRQPEVKVVLSIRSDRMSLLNQLTDLMPDILKNYYELKALDRRSAMDAIVKPAQDDVPDRYLSPVFTYSAESLQLILDYLTAGGEKSIETFQLQTICQYAEAIAIANDELTMRTQCLGSAHFNDLQNVFRSHYDNLIAKIATPEKRLAARLLIEDRLIVDGNRVSLPDSLVLKEVQRDTQLIAYLHDTHHLIRSEPNTTGGISYEISHDTLVAPILEAKKLREEREEEERAEAERLAELEQLRAKQRRDRRRFALVALALVLALALSGFALWQMFEAKKQRAVAQHQSEIADSKTKEAQQKSLALALEQKKLEKALKDAEEAKDTAEAEKIKAQLAKNLAEQQKLQAEIARKKAETMAEAVMPSEAKQDPFGYFWRKGKADFKGFNYLEAYTAILMAKNAGNLPTNKKDTVDKFFAEVSWYYEKYKKASGLLYDSQPADAKFAQAKKLFYEIHNRNPNDSLTWFLGKASADPRTEDMVLIKGGTFERVDKKVSDKKQTVSLSPYRIAKYEVTNAQYARFLNEYAALHSKQPIYTDSIPIYIDLSGIYRNEMKCGIYTDNGTYKIYMGYENRPVAWVSWYGADAFCRFYHLNLPSEAQWEFAAASVYPQGDIYTGNTPVYMQQYAGTDSTEQLYIYAWSYENSKSRTHSVGTKQPNAHGLYDMSGNVWEWCIDWISTYANISYSMQGIYPLKDPIFTKEGYIRVRRGGSWYLYEGFCRSAYRDSDSPTERSGYVGFRLSRN